MKLFPLLVLVTAVSGTLFGDTVRVNCSDGGNLQAAINHAERGDAVLFSGVCQGPVIVNKSHLTLRGSASGAAVDGHKLDAVTVTGALDVMLDGFDVQNGANGIVVNGGSQVMIRNVSVHDNAAIGILAEANSSATVAGGSTKRNGLNGVDVEAASSLVVTGSYAAEANAVFGININGSSSLLLNQANLTVNQNVLGIQIGTSASGFIADPVSRIEVANNVTTGLTIVSGAHMVAFGGTIIATGNGVHGVSVDSKAGLDLDAAALLDTHDNVGDGVHLEETSVLTLFNTPAFSGAPGTTTINAHDNGANGFSVLTGSNLTVIHQAAIFSTGNKGLGVQVDGGSGLTLVQSTVTGNKMTDIGLSFGSRLDITGGSIGSISCDSSVLSRGDKVCPR